MMETELLTAEEMCIRLQTKFDTFRRTWRRWKHERVGMGYTLRSMRFYWRDGPVKAEDDYNGSMEISHQKRHPVDRGRLQRRRADRPAVRLQEQGGGCGLGGGEIDLAAEARRFGLV